MGVIRELRLLQIRFDYKFNKFSMKKIIYTLLYTLSTPAFVLAQNPNFDYLTGTNGLIGLVENLISALLPVVISIGLLIFIWGMVVFIINSGNEQARAEGKKKMVWGIVILFVMVSVWGFVKLLQVLTGIENTAVTPPSVL